MNRLGEGKLELEEVTIEEVKEIVYIGQIKFQDELRGHGTTCDGH